MSQQESFEKEFSALRALGPSHFVLRGSTLIVELIDDEELKTKGGIIIAAPADHVKGGSVSQGKLQVARVLMVGEGYWDEDEKAFTPLDVSTGAIVILPQFATQFLSMFPGIGRPTGNKLAMIKADQILGMYPSPEAYAVAKAKLT